MSIMGPIHVRSVRASGKGGKSAGTWHAFAAWREESAGRRATGAGRYGVLQEPLCGKISTPRQRTGRISTHRASQHARLKAQVR